MRGKCKAIYVRICQFISNKCRHGFEEYLKESTGSRAKNFKSNEAENLKDSPQSGSTTTQVHRPKKSKSRKGRDGGKICCFQKAHLFLKKGKSLVILPTLNR